MKSESQIFLNTWQIQEYQHPQQGGKEQKQLLTGDNAYNFQGCIRNKFSMMVRLFFISVRISDGLKAMKS